MATHRPTPMIVMTPPAQPGAPSSPHPRRPPAHRSVSLVHSPKRKTSPPARDQSDSSSDDQGRTNSKGATDGKNSDGSPSSLQPLGRDSSGESSNAEKWFEKSNNEVRDSAPFADNDPPFFMRHSSSSETPPEVQQQQMRNLLANSNNASGSLPLRTGLLHLGTDGSSTEDYRGVIDDLTIENKKLKRKLKKYEKLHDSHLKDDKLFEVRIHGLPAAKKRELEDTLRKFTASLGSDSFPASGYEGIVPALPTLATHKTGTSSQASLQNADSAYASMSMSGQGSSAAQSGGETSNKRSAPNAALRRQNIHTYLHHIPEGLLPQPSPANMTERMKKKLVVRRLEQVFAGKGAVGGHHHPQQQQEVSQSAARADRAASEGAGRRSRQEGTREARIMRGRDGKETVVPSHNNASPDNSSPDEQQSTATGKRPADAISRQDSSVEQRPTRPLDLDPHRAQVPTDNILYMRHLGFSPPDPGSLEEAVEGHGWVYLNLLINMAQLHTINVTADFVRKAISEYSSKFELSHDERKVRWKGGSSVTRGSSSGGTSSNSRADINTPDRRSPRKRPKLSHRSSGKSGAPAVENNKLMYTPLFFHKDSTDDAEDSSEEEDDSMSSSWPAPAAGDSSGMTSSGGMRTSSSKRHKRDDGPIIFYNNARFCTDLSGDRSSKGNNAPPYVAATAQPIGMPQSSTTTSRFEKRGPLAEASELPEPMDLGDNPIPESMELGFPAQSPLSDEEKRAIKPVELEVTGIGGVWPTDNFSIAVESRHARVDQEQAPSVSHEKPPRSLPPRFARILDEDGAMRRTRAAVHKQVIVMERQELPPSRLPAALSYMPFSEDSNGDDSDVDDDVSVSPASPGEFPPATAPQPVQLHYASSEDEDDGYESSDDGSLDLLAAAREIDPDAVREQEREYDANMAERLAEEIPAGSSAATAGGGSGFASPASHMNREDYQKAVKNACSRQSLNRSQTTDSMKVNTAKVPAEQSSSEDEDEDEEMDDA
ncbi:Frequency clock protein [Pseudocercospora fuligena]|uniref:Frequency clock protein n=1 Tax=Pseudocercospora fuligena TaxID=685502 RepID=A0A8H6RGJ5_9PEZI|nr:Frequency clock protein [Pseudocercospora fuligena]